MKRHHTPTHSPTHTHMGKPTITNTASKRLMIQTADFKTRSLISKRLLDILLLLSQTWSDHLDIKKNHIHQS